MSLTDNIIMLVNEKVKIFINTLTDNKDKQNKMLKMWTEDIIPVSNLDNEINLIQCEHILLSGTNIGRKCGKKVSSKSKAMNRCITHLIPEINSLQAIEKTNITKLMDRVKIILFKNISGHLIDPNTRLVFDVNKLVIGKENNGKIIPLTVNDLDFCQKQRIEVAK